jgi:hypothetical protein
MVETAAHLVDNVIPRVPMRQWVLTVPKRIRYFLQRNPSLFSGVLRVFMRALNTALRRHSPGAPANSCFGAVAFLHRAGSSLNEHPHLHSAVTDGVFAPDEKCQAVFFPATDLTTDTISSLHQKLRSRILRYLERQGCPPFSSGRLGRLDDHTVAYNLPRPTPDGRTCLLMDPMELLKRLAALIPPPRVHLVRYFGVLAPNAALREQVIQSAGPRRFPAVLEV